MSNQPPYPPFPGGPMPGGMPPPMPKKGMSGCAIAAIVIGVLLVLVLIIGAAAVAIVLVAREADDDAASSSATPTSTAPLPEYGVDATGEVVAEQCRVSGTGVIRFEVNVKIQNASADRAYEYTVDLTFSMSDSQFGDPYWSQVETQEITVGAGRGRKIVMHASTDQPQQKYWYGCNVTRAVKSSVD